jgi:hypothetical protein
MRFECPKSNLQTKSKVPDPKSKVQSLDFEEDSKLLRSRGGTCGPYQRFVASGPRTWDFGLWTLDFLRYPRDQ